jgi:hypothetical protein
MVRCCLYSRLQDILEMLTVSYSDGFTSTAFGSFADNGSGTCATRSIYRKLGDELNSGAPLFKAVGCAGPRTWYRELQCKEDDPKQIRLELTFFSHTEHDDSNQNEELLKTYLEHVAIHDQHGDNDCIPGVTICCR